MANITGKNIIVDERQANILLISSVIDTQKWLKLWLKKHKKLTREDLKNLDHTQKTFMQSSLYSDLYLQACSELIFKNYEIMGGRSTWKNCGLCGEPNKYIYYYENKTNGIEINMGSDCKDKYHIMSGISESEEKALINKEIEFTQKNLLNEKFPGIISQIDNINKYMGNLKTFINKDIYDKLEANIIELNEMYKKYINSKKSNEKLQAIIKQSVEESEKLIKIVDLKIVEQKKREFSITNNIYNWVIKNGSLELKEFLMEDEEIKWRSAYRIFEPNLMKKIAKRYDEIFKRINFIYKDVEPLNKNIILEKMDNHMIISVPYSDFVLEYGGILFENENLNIDNYYIFKNCKITNSRSLSLAVELYKKIIRQGNLHILNYENDSNELIFKNNIIDRVFIIDLDKFVNNFKISLFENKNINSDELNLYILSNTKKNYTIEEYDEIEEELKKFEKLSKGKKI
jgi:hypothetical protein